MKKKLLSFIVMALLLVSIVLPLAACTPRDKTLRILSQTDYIDEDIFSDFKAANPDAKKVVIDYAPTNEEIYSKIANSRQDYDLICVSDYLVEQMMREELLSEPDFSEFENLGNISPYIWDRLSVIDNVENYAVPYMWGTMGIAYNTANVPLTALQAYNWDIFWTSPYSTKAALKKSMRDTYFAASMALNPLADPNSVTNISQIETKLNNGKNSIFFATVDEDRDALVNKSKDLCLQWAGDAIYCMELAAEKPANQRPDLYYYLPEHANIFVDCYVIPKYAGNPALAEKFMDFLCDEEVALANMEFIGYTSCVATPSMFESLVDYFAEYYDGELGLVNKFNLTDIDVSYFFCCDGMDYSELDLAAAALLWIQFPGKAQLDNCVLMRDFGAENLATVREMWSRWLAA